jgi:hypothetical protein
MKYCDINVFVLVKSSFPERVFLGEADYHGCIPETGIIISPLPPNHRGIAGVIYIWSPKGTMLPQRGYHYPPKTGYIVPEYENAY